MPSEIFYFESSPEKPACLFHGGEHRAKGTFELVEKESLIPGNKRLGLFGRAPIYAGKVLALSPEKKPNLAE